jgi:hypothetical protein
VTGFDVCAHAIIIIRLVKEHAALSRIGKISEFNYVEEKSYVATRRRCEDA